MIPLPPLKLSTRDKRVLIIGGIILTGLILLFGFVLPTLEEIRRLDRAIAKERQVLEEVRELHRVFEAMGKRQTMVQEKLRKRQQESFSIASVIEGMAREAALLEQVQYIKPDQGEISGEFQEASVSLKATEISPDTLVDFLHRIESSDRILRIRSLQIRTIFQQPGKLNMNLTVSTLLPVGESI